MIVERVREQGVLNLWTAWAEKERRRTTIRDKILGERGGENQEIHKAKMGVSKVKLECAFLPSTP